MTLYCINPGCKCRKNPDGADRCQSCGTPLLVNERFRLLEPLRPLDAGSYTDIFDVIDSKGVGFGENWVVKPGTRRIMKVLRRNWRTELVEHMQQEASVLRSLKHPGIPRCYLDDDFVFTHESLELHCLVLEKIEGQNLEDWLKQHGPISQSLALNWLEQLVHILDHVHQSGFFHRDIKPANIILQPSGELALIDFGGVRQVTETYLAKVSGAENTTGVNKPLDMTAVMTPGYTPPEQFNAKALPQSDFFAIGRTFAHLMTGIHPAELIVDKLTGELLWRNKAPQIDDTLASFIDELMALAPGKRPYNTRIILQRLNGRKPFESSLGQKKPIPGEMTLTINLKINEFPSQVWPTEIGYGFKVDTGDHFITVELKPESFEKLKQVHQNYSRWTATISGRLGDKTYKGFVLEDSRIRFYKNRSNKVMNTAKIDNKVEGDYLAEV